MSTTFDVFPSEFYIPTFDEVLRLSNAYLKNALEKNDITHSFQIDVQIRKKRPDIVATILKSGPAIWNDEEYAWFTVAGHRGGCDAYHWKIEEPNDICDGMFLPEGIEQNRDKEEKIRSMRDDIKKCQSVGYQWNFRRSVGQPAIINLSYGMIAAAFAKLTDGIIYSCDSAWDYSLFPAKAEEFLQNYFDPHCQDIWDRRFVEECLEDIRSHPFDP